MTEFIAVLCSANWLVFPLVSLFEAALKRRPCKRKAVRVPELALRRGRWPPELWWPFGAFVRPPQLRSACETSGRFVASGLRFQSRDPEPWKALSFVWRFSAGFLDPLAFSRRGASDGGRSPAFCALIPIQGKVSDWGNLYGCVFLWRVPFLKGSKGKPTCKQFPAGKHIGRELHAIPFGLQYHSRCS